MVQFQYMMYEEVPINLNGYLGRTKEEYDPVWEVIRKVQVKLIFIKW